MYSENPKIIICLESYTEDTKLVVISYEMTTSVKFCLSFDSSIF